MVIILSFTQSSWSVCGWGQYRRLFLGFVSAYSQEHVATVVFQSRIPTTQLCDGRPFLEPLYVSVSLISTNKGKDVERIQGEVFKPGVL